MTDNTFTRTRRITPDHLRAALESAGWRTDVQRYETTGVPWYAWRRLEGATDCACNDKPPPLCLTPYQIEHGENTWRSVQFEVCGEVSGGQWLKLQAYNVPMDEAMDKIDRCAELLRAAWNAAAAVGAGEKG